MELINLNKVPMAASMLGLGDSVFYWDAEEQAYLKAKISMAPELNFNKKPEYSIQFLSDSKYHKKGQMITVGRPQLHLEKKVASDMAKDFFMMID